MDTATRADRPATRAAAGTLREQLRGSGWRSDLAWVEVGARSAGAAVHAADGADVRRTIAYLPSVRALDGGAPRVWRDGAVPVPPQAEVREVMLATAGVEEWISEVFEAPAETVEQVEPAGAAAEPFRAELAA